MRLTISSLAALAVLSAGCAERAVEPGSRSAPGGPATLTIHLTDAPGDIKAAWVTIAEVYLQGTGGRTVLRNTPYSVDLVSLAKTSTVLLEDVQVAAGTYAELRFVVTGAYIAVEQAGGGTRIFASAPDYAELPPGAPVDGALQLPSFATSGLKVQLPDGMLTVPASGVVSLLVDFDVAQSFGHQAGNSGKWVMHPVITATNVTQGSMLMVTLALGTGVTLPAGVTLGNFAATLAAESAPEQLLASAAFKSPDGGVTYEAALGFVAPGSYRVNLVVPGTVFAVTVSPPVPFMYTAEAGPAKTLPFTLTGVLTLTSVSAGSYHTCGLTSAGTAYCWGDNSGGELGDGTPDSRLIPTAALMPTGVTFKSVSTGIGSCALSLAGAAYCWGSNVLSPTAALMPTGVTFKSVSTGFSHTCGVTDAGAAYCWGANSYGQLGDGTTTAQPNPTAVAMPTGVTFSSISAAAHHTCALSKAGTAYCWGSNALGQLGDGTTTDRHAPTAAAMPAGTTFQGLAAAADHSCALTPQGAAYCWGTNSAGELGDGTTSGRSAPTAVLMPTGITFTSVTVGLHTCGLSASGTAYCWGSNSSGQLGDGTTSDRWSPTAVATPVGVGFASVSAGAFHTCGLSGTGAAYCWGANTSGQLGDGSTTGHLTPTAVAQP